MTTATTSSHNIEFAFISKESLLVGNIKVS